VHPWEYLFLTSALFSRLLGLYLRVPGWYIRLAYAPEAINEEVQSSVGYLTFCVSSPPSKLATGFRFLRHIAAISVAGDGCHSFIGCYICTLSTIYAIFK